MSYWKDAKIHNYEIEIDDLYDNLLKQKERDIFRLQQHARGQNKGGGQQRARWNTLYIKYLKQLDNTQARINHMDGVA